MKYFSGIKGYLLQICLCVTASLVLINTAFPSLSSVEDARFEIIRVEIEQMNGGDSQNRPVTDFYLNGGEESGIKKSMVLDVYRDKFIRDAAGDNINISVPVGKVKVLKVYKDIAIARIMSLDSPDNTPVLEYRTVMLGDYAVLRDNKKLVGSLYESKEFPPGSGATLPSEVLFSINEWKLKPEAKEVLASIYDHYNNTGDKRIIVEGHTCSLGPEEYNQELSGKRARSVREYFLMAKGISPEKITIEFHGEKRPVAANSTKEGRAMNRRVNIRFLPVSK
jgi:outer membrane protein OmpA-like peptidoglycan-associated protein